MKKSHKLLALSTALLLTACGGGSVKDADNAISNINNEIPKIMQSNKTIEEKRNEISDKFNKLRRTINNISPPPTNKYSKLSEIDRAESSYLTVLAQQEQQEKRRNLGASAAYGSDASATEFLDFKKNMEELGKSPTMENSRKTRASLEKAKSAGLISEEENHQIVMMLSMIESLAGVGVSGGVPTRQSGVASTSSSRRNQDGVGRFDFFSEKHAVNLPVFIKLTGDMKSDINGSALWKVGKVMVGGSHFQSDSLSYLKSGHQKETNFVATFMSGKAFAELQFGAMSAENAYKSNWNGTQQLAVFGYDFDSGFTPFVEVSARQLKSDTADARNEVCGFAGVSVDINSTKNDFFKYDTLLTAKGGVKSFKTQNEFVSSFMLEHNFNVNSGVSFKTNMSFSSEADTSFKVSVGFSQ